MNVNAKIEYRIKRVERFIVTRHEDYGSTSSVRQIGNEYDNFNVAYEVGYALARADQERLGLPPGDMSVIFPSNALEDARSGPVNLASPGEDRAAEPSPALALQWTGAHTPQRTGHCVEPGVRPGKQSNPRGSHYATIP